MSRKKVAKCTPKTNIECGGDGCGGNVKCANSKDECINNNCVGEDSKSSSDKKFSCGANQMYSLLLDSCINCPNGTTPIDNVCLLKEGVKCTSVGGCLENQVCDVDSSNPAKNKCVTKEVLPGCPVCPANQVCYIKSGDQSQPTEAICVPIVKGGCSVTNPCKNGTVCDPNKECVSRPVGVFCSNENNQLCGMGNECDSLTHKCKASSNVPTCSPSCKSTQACYINTDSVGKRVAQCVDIVKNGCSDKNPCTGGMVCDPERVCVTRPEGVPCSNENKQLCGNGLVCSSITGVCEKPAPQNVNVECYNESSCTGKPPICSGDGASKNKALCDGYKEKCSLNAKCIPAYMGGTDSTGKTIPIIECTPSTASADCGPNKKCTQRVVYRYSGDSNKTTIYVCADATNAAIPVPVVPKASVQSKAGSFAFDTKADGNLVKTVDGNNYVVFFPDSGLFDVDLGGEYVVASMAVSKDVQYMFYVERNGSLGYQAPFNINNVGESEDLPVSIQGVSISVGKKAEISTLTLKNGINLISFPYLVSVDGKKSMQASELMAIANVNGTLIRTITFFDEAAGKWAAGITNKSANAKAFVGTDFTILPGNGYLIIADTQVPSSGVVQVPSYQFTSVVPISFSAGWNLVGVHGYPKQFKAFELLRSINAKGKLTADDVSYWDTSRSNYVGAILDSDQEYGIDFSIVPEQGYFVRIKKVSDNGATSVLWSE